MIYIYIVYISFIVHVYNLYIHILHHMVSILLNYILQPSDPIIRAKRCFGGHDGTTMEESVLPLRIKWLQKKIMDVNELFNKTLLFFRCFSTTSTKGYFFNKKNTHTHISTLIKMAPPIITSQSLDVQNDRLPDSQVPWFVS